MHARLNCDGHAMPTRHMLTVADGGCAARAAKYRSVIWPRIHCATIGCFRCAYGGTAEGDIAGLASAARAHVEDIYPALQHSRSASTHRSIIASSRRLHFEVNRSIALERQKRGKEEGGPSRGENGFLFSKVLPTHRGADGGKRREKKGKENAHPKNEHM